MTSVPDINLALYLVFLIGFMAFVFLDWIEWSTRLSELGASRLSTLRSPTTLWSSAWLVFMVVELPGGASEQMIGHGKPLVRFSLLVAFIGALLASYLLAYRRTGPAASVLARGVLRERIRSLARAASIRTTGQQTWGVDSFSICVLPDGFEWWAPSVNRSGMTLVMVPLRFLNWFSRDEVDALAARQLARRQWKYRLLALFGSLVYAAVATTVLLWLKLDPPRLWIVVLLLLVVETAALAMLWPALSYRAELRAIQITGNPEAYISALVELARFNNSSLDQSMLRNIAERTGVRADRLDFLLKPQPRPASDRYPTTGDYFTTGL